MEIVKSRKNQSRIDFAYLLIIDDKVHFVASSFRKALDEYLAQTEQDKSKFAIKEMKSSLGKNDFVAVENFELKDADELSTAKHAFIQKLEFY